LHQRQHFLGTRQARRRNHASEEYGNDKPRNKSLPECSHILIAPILFPRIRYRCSVGPQQGKGCETSTGLVSGCSFLENVLRINRSGFTPLAISPTCDGRDRTRTKAQQNQRDWVSN
jgi:hypothetical protein